MSYDENTYLLIESYLNEGLSGQDLKDFEDRIAQDQELKNEIELYRLMEGYIGENDWPESTIEGEHPKVKAYTKQYMTEDVKTIALALDTLGENAISNTSIDQTSSRSLWKVFSAAATILLLVGCLWFFTKGETAVQFANNVEHESLILNQRGEGDVLLAEAEVLYNSNKYEEVLPKLEVLVVDNDDYNLVLALGITYMELKDFSKAGQAFYDIIGSDALIKDQAYYYAAINTIQAGHADTAKEILLNLQKKYPSFKTEDVAKLIQKLK